MAHGRHLCRWSLHLASAPGAPSGTFPVMDTSTGSGAPKPSTLQRYGATFEELERIVDENPSLRSFVVGYLNEERSRVFLADSLAGVLTDGGKPNDHDRSVKADRVYTYRGFTVRLEVKGVQTASVRHGDGVVSASFQCDASDARPVLLPSGVTVVTSCLLAGEFDVVAVPLFELCGRWEFAFAANRDLRRTSSPKFASADRSSLLATLQPVSYPVAPPFTTDLRSLLDRMVAAGQLTRAAT
jgi:hypothetical protein